MKIERTKNASPNIVFWGSLKIIQIVVSTFLGWTMLAIYQNYYFIITAIIGFVTIIFNACTAGIGTSLIVKTQEKNFNDLKNFTFLIAWIAGVCNCCFLCIFQPFMVLWMGEEHLLPFSAVVFLIIYYLRDQSIA